MKDKNSNDLRVKKTRLSLLATLAAQLNRRSFSKITTSDLCREAMVGRASFYSHFNDKYDLLRELLSTYRCSPDSDELELCVDGFINANKKLIKNIVSSATDETLDILHDFFASIIVKTLNKNPSPLFLNNPQTITCFCTGGLLKLLTVQAKSESSSDEQPPSYGEIINLISR